MNSSSGHHFSRSISQLDDINSSSSKANIRKKYDIVQLKQVSLDFSDKKCNLIIIKNLTEIVKYQQTEIENRLYDLFTATVSHEMRTPLNSILSMIKIVIRQVKEFSLRTILSII